MSLKKIKFPDGEIRWEAVVQVAGRGSKTLRRRFDTKIMAENFILNFRTERARNITLGNTSSRFDETTFQEEAEYWLKKKKIEFSPSHIKRVEGLMRVLKPLIGSLTPDKLTACRLSDIQDDLFAKGQKPPTIRRTTDLIRGVLAFSVRMKRIPFDPSRGFEPLKSPRKSISFWEECEAVQFLEFADRKYCRGTVKRWTYLVYLVGLNTGLRAGEILGLRARSLVGDGNLLKIEGQFDRVARVFRCCKDGEQRIVPCNSVLRDEIRTWIAQRNLRPDDYLFAINSDQPVDYNNLRARYFQKDLRESGVRKIRFHDLRHSTATLMISKRIDLPTVKEILGHSSIATTQIYVHALGDSIKQAALIFSIVPQTTPSLAGKTNTHLRIVG